MIPYQKKSKTIITNKTKITNPITTIKVSSQDTLLSSFKFSDIVSYKILICIKIIYFNQSSFSMFFLKKSINY